MSLRGVLVNKMRQPMMLQEPSETSGNAVVTWTDVGEIFISREALATANRTGLVAEAEYRLVAYYRAGVTTKMRLREDTRTYDILWAGDPDGRRQAVHLLVVERVH